MKNKKNMKRVLFVGLTYHHHIINFSQCLKQLLDYEISAFNIIPSLYSHNEDLAIKTYNVSGKMPLTSVRFVDILSRLFVLPFVFWRFCRKYDLVQFHYVSKYTLPMLLIAKMKGNKTSTFVWGSDLLRTGKIYHLYLALIFRMADSIVCDSTTVLNVLKDNYPEYKEKMEQLYFGSIIIDKLIENENICTTINIPNDKITVMCGYNGGIEQNHIQIIRCIKELIPKCYFIIPMTYKKSFEYIEKVKDLLDSYNASYILLQDFIDDDVWADYIKASDVFIHMQTTDAFSSTLSEHLLVGNVVINAQWLKYDDLENERVYYVEATFENLEISLHNIINNLATYRDLAKGNREKLIKLKSLKYCVLNYWSRYYDKFSS